MTREGYEVARFAIHGGAATLAVILTLLFCRFRHKLPWRAGVSLSLAAFVFIESAVFPFWFLIVTTEVPIRDEGLAVGLMHLFAIGPLALLGVLLSAFQKEIRWLGIGLSLGFAVLSPIALLFDM